MNARVPDGLRASAQSLFYAVVFGLGGILGQLASGWCYERFGGEALFTLAAWTEVVPAFVFAVMLLGQWWVRAGRRVR